jgi:pseudouridylate synthase
MNPHLHLGPDVAAAQRDGRAIVALESAVLTHGLPHPRNLEALERMDRAAREAGAIPAVCLTHHGSLWVGAPIALAREVAQSGDREKASVRDLGRALALKAAAGLTVSATLQAAHLAGIRVFATGGIGGVHSGAAETGDVSADLLQLSRTPIVTVCSGAKSVLDIPRTLEFLEMAGVPVYAYRTDCFPAFYLTSSGSRTTPVGSAKEIADIARMQWELGSTAGVVVANPIPSKDALPPEEWQLWLREAEAAARNGSVRGKDVTPFLLSAVAVESAGRTVEANLALLESNARLAGEIAAQLTS